MENDFNMENNRKKEIFFKLSDSDNKEDWLLAAHIYEPFMLPISPQDLKRGTVFSLHWPIFFRLDIETKDELYFKTYGRHRNEKHPRESP